MPSKCDEEIAVSSNKLTYQVLRLARLDETRMKMAGQKQHLPSFATTISVLGILLYCAGFLRVELELNKQKKRLNALENNPETKPPSSDPDIVKIIKDTRGMYTVSVFCFVLFVLHMVFFPYMGLS